MKFKGITKKPKAAKQYVEKKESSKKKIVGKKPQFPNIYRNITERVSRTVKQPRFWIAVITAVFLLCLLGIVFLVFQQVVELKKTLESRHETANTLSKWEAVISKYPNLRDGYLGAGEIAYQLGDLNKALMYVQKALELDPNFGPSKKLETAIKARK